MPATIYLSRGFDCSMIGDPFFFLKIFIHTVQLPVDTYLSAKWPRLHGIPVQYHLAPARFAKSRPMIIMATKTVSATYSRSPAVRETSAARILLVFSKNASQGYQSMHRIKPLQESARSRQKYTQTSVIPVFREFWRV